MDNQESETKTTTSLKKKENQFEFALSINGNKIISRYFSADEYNPKVRYSVDIRDMVDEIVEKIREGLKQKDVDFMWEQYDLRVGKYANSAKENN